ncbi:MAG: aquaporin family protein [Thermoplasmata archaeon]|nr:aquaporin family protein [Thermoplasmata archaeon]MCI4361623.1 aquaporin family protein [Thermoplasmata archaeon]
MTPGLGTRLLSETLGTALLVGIGTGAVVASAGTGSSRFLLLAVAWFLAVSVPVALFAGISGAHLNPVVTLALVADRRVPVGELPPHVVAQVVGAFLGSATVALALGTGSHLGATVPSTSVVEWIFLDEFGFTFVLVASVLLLVRAGPGRWRWRLTWPGLVVAVSTYLIGPITGSSLNPARSLAPAVLSSTYTDLWVYFVAALFAALLAVAVVGLLDGPPRMPSRSRVPEDNRPPAADGAAPPLPRRPQT